MRPRLEQRVHDLGLGGAVRFLGFRDAPDALMAGADLLVLSSDQEGLPSLLIKALYAGLRVVSSTDCGAGIGEILLNEFHGTIVPVRDPRAMASAIEAELRTPVDRVVQIAGIQRFSPDRIASQFLGALGLRAAG